MTNFVLYRKQIEILEITKNLYKEGNYHGGYRESIDELFFEKDNHLRMDFLEIIPVDKLESAKELLCFLKTVNASYGNGEESTISSYFGRTKNSLVLLTEIEELQDLISKECNNRFHFGVFYSWQSDSKSKYNRNFIEAALSKSINVVNMRVCEGPFISLDKDTRNIPGSPDITPTISQKIDRSICFVADVTPIVSTQGKQIPNPNVMFELGYAISSLSYERVIIICNTAHCKLKELPFDLGLKRIISYQYDEKTNEEEKKKCKKTLEEDLVRALTAIVSL